LGNGVVIDAGVLLDEMKALADRGVDTSRLLISANAHLIGSYHSTVDKVSERFLGRNRIGTTGRGIGPAYADKISRLGVRIGDLFDEKILRQKLEGALEQKNHLLVKVYNRRAIDVDDVLLEFTGYAEALRPYVADTSRVLNAALDAGRTVVFEGAQATLLDVDHGTYPFVTSSNPTAGGACVGAGVGPTRIDRVVGVVKAYTTRVGSGPFPTELVDADGERLREIGGEFGTTTGRERRCGWYDAVVARFASRVNGLTDLFLTKLDILGAWESIPVCVGYEIDGERHDEMPMTQTEFHHSRPVYERFDGWGDDISGCRSFDELPANAQAYVRALEDISGAPFCGIGVGPGRDQTIPLRPLP
jgi:adenylosuccinate synthase